MDFYFAIYPHLRYLQLLHEERIMNCLVRSLNPSSDFLGHDSVNHAPDSDGLMPPLTTPVSEASSTEGSIMSRASMDSAMDETERGYSTTSSNPSSLHIPTNLEIPNSSVDESKILIHAKQLCGRRRKVSIDVNDEAQRFPNKKLRRDGVPESVKYSDDFCTLAQLEDAENISPLHIFIRKQIEIFTASPAEMEMPAPGRKVPIQLKQVGLRCIHCRNLPPNERAKRAICYPSSVGRVYNSVSDMKFDHFPNCKALPDDIKQKFLELKNCNKSKSPSKVSTKRVGNYASTSQYYHDSALRLGLTTRKGGVFMQRDIDNGLVQEGESDVASDSDKPETKACSSPPVRPSAEVSPTTTMSTSLPILPLVPPFLQVTPQQQTLAQTLNILRLQQALQGQPSPRDTMDQLNHPTNVTSQEKTYRLCSPSDSQHLNPIHCFVRCHVEFFAAKEEDLAAPAPGRKTPVVLGQVGVRCLHCAKLPPRDRVKRSVCYPSSVSGIYHSVSNMKFDHFMKCKGLPEDQRTEFLLLRQACQRGRKEGAPGDLDQLSKKPGGSNSTAQYYHDSAIRLGLTDTETGIRFGSPPQDKVQQNNGSFDNVKSDSTISTSASEYSAVSDGMSALMIAAMVRLQSSAAMKC